MDLRQSLRPVLDKLTRVRDIVRTRIFGVNNERLDFIMDSFYKLSPQHQTGVVFGVGAGLLAVLALVFYTYFAAMRSLESRLTNGFDAIYSLRKLSEVYNNEQGKYNSLLSAVRDKTAGLRLKPFFERKANDTNVQIQGLTDDTQELPAENPLSKDLSYVNAEMRMSNISIPKLLNFIIETEKADNFIKVEDLDIKARYGTKLFFDATVKFKGYAMKGR